MKLYFRLIWVLLASPFKKKTRVLDDVVTHWKVLPNDLDLYRHMNNGRYPLMMDLARVDFIIRLGMTKKMIQHRWVVPVGSTQLDFKTALAPFAEYRISTQVCYWDDKWFYFRQEFRRDKEPYPIVATGYVKALFKGPNGLVSPDEVLLTVDQSVTRPILTKEIAHTFQLPYLQGKAPLERCSPKSHNENTNENPSVEPIAIVGIGCRFPGGIESPDDLWKVLLDAKDCIVDIPSERWDPKKFHDPSGKSPGRSYVHKGGMLSNNIYEFDPAFFGISPREAEVMDPMQRLLMEISWEAFEDAGINVKAMAGSNTSVFVGGFITDNMLLQSSAFNRQKLASHSAISSTLTMLSSRLSYFYDFRGPSMSLDTACSSSLVALHQACQTIWNGDSDCSLVGGVNMLLVPETQITMSKGKFLSPAGRCNAFGAGADGYVRGEGAGLVVLKPLSHAIKDGNQIYSVIRGTAVNQDGKTNGITVPNEDAQIAAMQKSYSMAGIQPSQINYLEAHGTGTPVGDPIEARALGAVISIGRSKKDPCPMGSIKTNLGHMEAAAGIAGLIKASLVLKHRTLVPHLHLTELNPGIDLDTLRLRIPVSIEKLPAKGVLYAGVNSFGYGGTNAHVVLASAPSVNEHIPVNDRETEVEAKIEIQKKKQSGFGNVNRPIAIPLSASNENSLCRLAQSTVDKIIEDQPDIRTFAAALGTQRSHLKSRAWIQGNNKDEIITSLRILTQGQTHASTVLRGENDNPKIMFVYTGMGPQWWAMGKELYLQEPVYKNAVDECDRLFGNISGWSILTELNKEEADSQITLTRIAQPANLVVQVGITALLKSWGVEPSGVVGHSIGEVGAAWASGGLSLENALTVAYHRSRLQDLTAGKGGMLAVGLSPEEAKEWVDTFGDKVSVAAINSASAVTLAGDLGVLKAIAAKLEVLRRFNKFLKVEVPYHSPVMDEIEGQLKEALKDITTDRIHTYLISTVTGTEKRDAHDAGYWWQNVRQSVLFSKAVSTAVDKGYNLFVEVGPHPVLASSIWETANLEGSTIETIATLVRKKNEMASMSLAIGKLYCHGVDIDDAVYFGTVTHQKLPTYPWDKKVYWAETERSKRYRLPHDGHPMVSRQMSVPTLSWFVDLNTNALPYIQDHQVAGSILFPGAGHVELGLGLAGHLKIGDNENVMGITLEDIEFLAPAVATEDEVATLQAIPDTENQTYKVFYQRGDAQPVVCAQGRYYSGGEPPRSISLSGLALSFSETWDKSTLYAALEKKGLEYGQRFQAVDKILLKEREVLAYLSLPEGNCSKGYFLHPVMLDAALHSLIAGDTNNAIEFDIVPTGIKRIQWFKKSESLPNDLVAHGRITERSKYVMSGDIVLYSSAGEVVTIVSGLNCRIMPRAVPALREKVNKWTYSKTWDVVTPQPGEAAKSVWVVIPGQNKHLLTIDEQDLCHFLFLPDAWTIEHDGDALLDMLSEASKVDGSLNVLDLRFHHLPFNADDELVNTGIEYADKLLKTLQHLGEFSLNRYVLITQNGETISLGDNVNLVVAPLVGLARTAMTERPKLNITVVDQHEDAISQSFLTQVLPRFSDIQELGVREGKYYALRLVPTTMSDNGVRDYSIPALEATAYEMRQPKIAKIESIAYFEVERRSLSECEVEVEVDTCSLHFKDLMKAMDILSKEAEANTFFEGMSGMEGAGLVTAIGPNITKFKVGDRVYARGQFMRSHTVSNEAEVVKLPDNISLVDGANLVTYLTVYHSLTRVARLAKGETLLIHSAAGGIGLAAIHLARWMGANIIVTAGTDEKRRYLKSLGIKQVSNSRTLGFVDDIQRWTSGRGIDVVLNFTPGEIMKKSIDCLAPFGRFVELGKVSFDNNEALHLRPFTENLTYSAVDFDRLCKTQPVYMNELVVKVLELMSSGEIPPLPCEVFPASQTVEAFRTMARAKHIGKLAIKIKDSQLKVQPAKLPGLFNVDGSYVITGGLGGFGLQVADWMSASGAGHLVLLSRRGASTEEAKNAIRKMKKRGTQIHAYSVDVSDTKKMTAVFDDLKSMSLTIKGVLHAAAVLDDKILQDIDRASLDKVITTKAGGAWLLHQLTVNLDLDFMIFFSSISSLVGNAGQANYVAANNFLDQLAHYRHEKGLPATSINWGVFAETGIVARNDQLAKHLSHIGITPFTSEQATAALGLAVNHSDAQIGIMNVDWNRFVSLLTPGAGVGRFEQLLLADNDKAGVQSNAQLASYFGEASGDERLELILKALVKSVASTMRIEQEQLKPSQSLRDLGLDSLMAVEIGVDFTAQTGLGIPPMEIASGPAIDALGKILLGILNDNIPVKNDSVHHAA